MDAVKIAEQTQKALHYFLDYQSKLPKDSDVWEQYNEIAQRLVANLETLQVLSKPLRAFANLICRDIACSIWELCVVTPAWRTLASHHLALLLYEKREDRQSMRAHSPGQIPCHVSLQ